MVLSENLHVVRETCRYETSLAGKGNHCEHRPRESAQPTAAHRAGTDAALYIARPSLPAAAGRLRSSRRSLTSPKSCSKREPSCASWG